MLIFVIIYKRYKMIKDKTRKDLKVFIEQNYINNNLLNDECFILSECSCDSAVYANKAVNGLQRKAEFEKCKSRQAVEDFVVAPKFSDVLIKYIDKKQMTDVECYKKAGIDRRLFSKIRSDKDYQPSKKTVLAFVLALKLSYDEALELLDSAGYTLSHSYLRDVIIEYCINKKIYKIFDVNVLLTDYGEEPILFE